MAEIKSEINTDEKLKVIKNDSEATEQKIEMNSEPTNTETKEKISANQKTIEEASKEPLGNDGSKDKKDESVESGFEIINKEASASKETKTNEEMEGNAEMKQERKKSIVDVSIIKEKEDLKMEESLEKSLNSMPGMTKSISKEILKATDETELKKIAQELSNEAGDACKEDNDGSVIDISIVDDSDGDKEPAQTNFEAEILDDDEEVTIVPADDEAVVEFTLEMKHAIPLISLMVGVVAALYAAVFYANSL